MKRFKIDSILGTMMAVTMVCLGGILFCGAGLINNSDQWFKGNITFENNLNATGTKLNITGGVPRSQLSEDALADIGFSIYGLRNPNGTSLVATESGNCFNFNVESAVVMAFGEVCDNETETSVTNFQFVLPDNYVAGGDVSVSIRCALIKSGSPVNDGSTIDITAYEQGDGATGSDLCATAAATFAALDTWYTKTFTLTSTNLAPGDVVNVFITGTVKDTEAGGGTITLKIDAVNPLCDVKG